tara:strand:+ start:43 stop:570 length:528 start_codon:yes stop_codon:yes gene_type:complete
MLKSLDGCRLKIGSYPYFLYNADGGGGEITLIQSGQNNILFVKFLSNTFTIPPLTYRTTRFLSLPLPPGLKIDIKMNKLEGRIDKSSGEVLLKFESKFVFSIGRIIKFPDLLIKTLLTTGKVKGKLHGGEGKLLQKNGKVKLIGISTIPITKNSVLNTFLGLPNEALAELNCEIK